MENIFETKPIYVYLYDDIRGKPVDTIVFGKPVKKGGDEFFEEVQVQLVNLDIFPQDSIYVFKEKLYLACGRVPGEQCLFTNELVTYAELEDTRISLTNLKFTEKLDGFYVFKHLYAERESIKIYDFDHMNILSVLQDAGKHFEINCYLQPPTEQIQPENLRYIYWSNIIFFPYLPMEAYTNKGKFPNLYPDREFVLGKLSADVELYHNIYKTLAGNLDTYNISLLRGENNPKAKLTFTIRQLKVFVEEFGIPNMDNIYALFQTTPEIPLLVYRMKSGLLATKAYFKSEKHFNEKNHKKSRYSTLCFYTVVSENVVLFELLTSGRLIAVYRNNYYMRDFVAVKKIISAHLDKLNKALSKISISIFSTLQVQKYYNILNIDAQLVWVQLIDVDFYNELLSKFPAQGVVEPKQRGEVKPDTFLWLKNVPLNSNAANEYSYLYENTELQPSNRLVKFTNKYTELQVTLKQFSQEEFEEFLAYFIHMLKTTSAGKTTSNSKMNNLKMLRSIDPKNYDIGKISSEVYARFCQKAKQPIPVDEPEHVDGETAIIEGKPDDRYLKFWNYTRKEPQWFYCPNTKYPVPGFIIGHHPEGYCHVCCKKKKKTGKYLRVHEACLEDKIINKNTFESSSVRYVINFGKLLDRGRLGFLPDVVNKFLVYNLEDINVISESVSFNVFRYNEKIYSVDKLLKFTKNTRVQRMPLAPLAAFMHQPLWKRRRMQRSLIRPIDVLSIDWSTPANRINHRKHYKHYKRILEADLNSPIIVMQENSTYVVIDGYHRLARAFHEKAADILCKIITPKQLQRSFIGKYDLSGSTFVNTVPSFSTAETGFVSSDKVGGVEKYGGSDKDPFYYLIGVTVKHSGQNCSVLNSLALVLDKSLEDFVTDICKRLEKLDYVGSYDAREIRSLIREFFIEDKLVDYDWEKLFLDILPTMYNLTLIVMEYNHYVSLLLHENFVNWRERENYVMLFRYEGIYTPIVVGIPYAYQKTSVLEKTMYSYDDHIVKIFEQLVKKKKQDALFTVEKLTEFCTATGYTMNHTLAFSDKIYAVELSTGKKEYVYVAIEPLAGGGSAQIDLQRYKMSTAKQFLEKYSSHFGVDTSINKLFTYQGVVAAYKVGEYVNFATGDLDVWWNKSYEMEYWNYNPNIIINAKLATKDPLYTAYTTLRERMNDYIYYKEDMFALGPKMEEALKRDKTDFGEALREEMRNPVKRMLFDRGIYNFTKLYINKHDKENIYIL